MITSIRSLSALVLLAALALPLGARAAASAPFPEHYKFMVNGTLQETGSMSESSSPYFWLNSGGKFILEGGVGKTLHGALPASDTWHDAYNRSSATDTESGSYPQNLFRLVLRDLWTHLEASVRFKIDAVHLTDTPNRDGYSGILLMSRYKDGNNLYYAGIRHDGQAIIKKKVNGSYTTLASAQIFGKQGDYDKWSNPNLIPENSWMRLKTRVFDLASGGVRVEVWLDREDDGSYERILFANDRTNYLSGKGHAGIRTDYMDITFDDLVIKKI